MQDVRRLLATVDLSRLVSIAVLAKILPQLVRFRTCGARSHPDENVAQLIILLVTHFEHLMEVNFNEGSFYRRDGHDDVEALKEQQVQLTKMLRSTPKLCDPDRSSIERDRYVDLKIRL